MSFCKVRRDEGGELSFDWLGSVKHRDKIQHAVFVDERRLLVGFEHRIEDWLLNAPVRSMKNLAAGDFSIHAAFEHAHLAGLHTVEPMGAGRVLAACSAPDAALICDLNNGNAERTLRMPARLYGKNYHLTAEMDLRRHYIHDGCQTTHLNAASLDRSGRRVVVSTLMQGAIGIFDLETAEYEEVTRGFVGCHGVRFNQAGQIYFADSPGGALVILRSDGTVERRFEVGSRWLHDVQQLWDATYAFALADSNELRVYDIDRGEVVFQRTFPVLPFGDSAPVPDGPPEWLGNSTQALSYTGIV